MSENKFSPDWDDIWGEATDIATGRRLMWARRELIARLKDRIVDRTIEIRDQVAREKYKRNFPFAEGLYYTLIDIETIFINPHRYSKIEKETPVYFIRMTGYMTGVGSYWEIIVRGEKKQMMWRIEDNFEKKWKRMEL